MPPPHFTWSLPGRKSISSWITTISDAEILKNRAASATASPEAFIKVCGFSNSRRSPPSLAFRELALEPAAKARKTVPPGDRVDRHEADVVAVSSIASTRVAEADDETHHHPIADAAKLRLERSASGRLLGRGKPGGGGSFLTHRR